MNVKKSGKSGDDWRLRHVTAKRVGRLVVFARMRSRSSWVK